MAKWWEEFPVAEPKQSGDRWWEQFPMVQNATDEALVPKKGAPGEMELVSRDEYVGMLLDKNQKAIQLERDKQAAKEYVDNALPGQALAAQVTVDLTSPVTRMLGMDEQTDERIHSADLTEQALADWEQGGVVPDILQRGFRGAVRSLASALVGSRLGRFGGRSFAAPGAIGIGAVQEGNRAITEGRDAGLEGASLAAYAASQGVIEALPAAIMQRAGLGGLESLVAGQAVKTGVRQGVIEAIKRTGMEIPEEVVTEVAHLAAQQTAGLDKNALSGESLANTIADTIVQTVLTMGMAEIASAAGNAISQPVFNALDKTLGNAFRKYRESKAEEAALQAERDATEEQRRRLLQEQAEKRQGGETQPEIQPPTVAPEQTPGVPADSLPPAGETGNVPPTAKPGEEVIQNGQNVQQGNVQGNQEGSDNQGGQGQVGDGNPTLPDSPSAGAVPGDTLSPDTTAPDASGAEGGRTSPPSAQGQGEEQPDTQQPTKRPGGPMRPGLIGTNSEGKPVYERPNGQRYILDEGVEIEEKVTLRPKRRLDGGIEYVGEIDKENREDRFKPVGETQTESRPADETQKQITDTLSQPEQGEQEQQVDENGFAKFAPETGTLGIPRAEMPQVKSEQRGALANFARARGVDYERVEVLPTDLKPSQAEYSPAKVQKAREFEGVERAILVSKDGYIVDGHHQWKRNLEDRPNEPMEVIQLGTDAKSAIDLVREFPSSQTSNETGDTRRIGQQDTTGGNVVAPDAQQGDGDFKANLDAAVERIKRVWGQTVTPREPKTAEEQEQLDFLKSRGKQASFVDSDGDFTGAFDGKTGTILIAGGGDTNDVWRIIGHEVAHETELDKIIPVDSAELEVGRKNRLARAKGPYKKRLETEPELLDREARADIIGEFMRDKGFRDKLSRENPTLWERLRDAVLKVVGKWTPRNEAQALVLEELRKKPEKRKLGQPESGGASTNWRRQPEETQRQYRDRLKKQGWKDVPKPSITVLDSPGEVLRQSQEQIKKDPYSKGDRVVVSTGYANDEMQIGGTVLEPTASGDSAVRVRLDNGVEQSVSAYYTNRESKKDGENTSTSQPASDTVSPESTAEIPQLDDAELEAMIEAEFDAQLGTKPKKKPPTYNGESGNTPPRRIGQPQQQGQAEKPDAKPPTRIGQARDDVRKKKADLYKQWNDEAKNKLTSGLDPSLGKLAVQIALAEIQDGTLTFAAFVESVAKNVSAELLDKAKPYFEKAWQVAHKRGMTDDPGGRFDDYLNAESGDGQQTDSGRDQEGAAGGRGVDADTEVAEGGESAGALGGVLPGDDKAAEGSGDTGRVRGGDKGKVREGSGGDGEAGADAGVRGGAATPGDAADGAGKGKKPRGSGRGGRDANVDGDSSVRGSDGTGTDKAPTSVRPNFHLTDPEKIVGGGQKTKFERNRKAIEIVQDIEQSGRAPTQEELETLAAYTGWGAFGQELFQGTWDRPMPKDGWQEQDEWLRSHLGEEEWRSAQQSIVNAHYTDPETVQGMWDMIRQMGFKGGRVLEPSMGVGNFFAMMPRDMMNRSTLTGIELDSLTARIAKILYPQANIQQKGYQESETPNNFYDLVVSNVPFGNYKISDRRYRQDFSIHNYFFRRAIDHVKPGGVVAFLTSNMTMDGSTQAKILRQQLSEMADVVGVYRFPSGAFQKYAGTKVVADLIVLRKRKPGEQAKETNWIDVVGYMTPSGQEIKTNAYWIDNPENIMGTMDYGTGTTTGRPGMIVRQPDNLSKLWSDIVSQAPKGIFNTERSKTEGMERPNTKSLRQNTVVAENDDLYIAKGEQLLPLVDAVKWKQGAKKKETVDAKRQAIEDLIKVRDVVQQVLEKQGRGEDAGEERKQLNDVYDRFVAKHGFISDSDAYAVLAKAGDPLATSLKGIESPLPDGGYEKRPIFTRATVRTKRKLTNLTLDDALALARNESVDIDWDLVAKAANMDRQSAIAKLESEEKIFKIGDDQYDAADVFLSGNMARKIRMLEAAQAEGVKGLERSLDAARNALPAPVAYTQIEVNLGAPWIEASDYSEFVANLLNEPTDRIEIAKGTRGWKVNIPTDINGKPEATAMHGSRHFPFSRMVAAALNNSTVTIRYPDPMDPTGKKMLVDEQASAEVNGKINDLKDKFREWIWTSQDRTQRLTKVYNEEFNSTVTPTYENVPLVFEGLALQRGDDPFSLRQHQESAVYRGIVSGKGLFAHEVGTGKTLTMGALAMESRRLGLANKPILLGHNANAPSVAREIQEAYPNAKILYIDNLDPKTRDETLGAIATEDWDLIVVPHSLVDRFKMRPETLERMLKREMDELEAAAYEAYDEDDSTFKGAMPTDLDNVSEDELRKLRSPTAKELVKERMKLRSRITDAHLAAKGERTIFFEDMGIDMVMVDEAHLFKKLPISTKQRLKGLNTTGSQRGTMLMLLTDFIREQTGGRGTYLFTGTPITNTVNEIYNMMRFVMPNEMESAGVRDWDSWFNTFATSESNFELSSGGTFETFDRLSSFINLPELRQMAGQYMDIVFADQMPEFHDRDSRDGRTENPIGRPFKQIHNETLVMSEAQKKASDDLKRRYTRFKNARGKEKRDMMKTREFNPLVIEGEGVKLALDPRLVDGVNSNDIDPKDPSLKINRMIQNAMVHYRESETSTQMVFMQTGHSDYVDRVVGKAINGKDVMQKFKTFNLAKEIKRRLIEEGVPESEIVIMSAIDGREKRKEAADKMQRGEVRFAIGSTETMGTGVNAQNEMVSMHHLDAPWMPGDLEQRNGRGHRQGNRWNTVHEYRYLTEGPQDGRRWQVLLTKDRFIRRFMRADGSERSIDMDDIDLSDEGETNDMEQTFAAAAGDPRLMIRAKLEKDIEKMDSARHRFYRAIQDAVEKARQRMDFITMAKDRIALQQADYDAFVASRPADGDKVSLKIRDQTLEGRDAIDDALKGLEERYRNSIMPKPMDIGEFRGLRLRINNSQLIVGESMTAVKYSLQSLQQTLTNMPNTIAKGERQIAKDEEFIKLAENNVGQPFPKQAQLDAKRKKLESLLKELAQNPQGSPAWFRNTVPIGSSFFHNGVEYEVAGHRGDTHILRDQDGEIVAVPAEEAMDEQGTPLFPMLQKQQDADDKGQSQPPSSMSLTVPTDNSQRPAGDSLSPSTSARKQAAAADDAQPIRQADIVTTWSRLFKLAIKLGGYRDGRRGGKSLGIYKYLQEIVRMREGNAFDIIVASHEIGHHLDKVLNLYNRNSSDSKLKQLRKSDRRRYRKVLGQLQALDYDHPSQKRIYEGIAEAVRQILTGTAVNGRLGPDAVAWVEEQIMADPVYGAALKQAVEQAKQYQDQGAIKRARAVFGGPPMDLSAEARRKKLINRIIDGIYKNFFNARFIVDKFDRDIAKSRKLGEDEASIGEMISVFDARVNAMAAKAFKEGVHTLDGTFLTDRTLTDAQKLLKDGEDRFGADAYMVARYGLTKPRSYNFGMDRQDAREYIQWVESDPDRAQRWQEYHRIHTEFFNAFIALELSQGAIDREEAMRIFGQHGDLYVPLMREMGEDRMTRKLGGGSQMIELPKAFQRRTKSGSGRPVMPMLEQAAIRARHHYGRVVRQHIHNTIVNQISTREGLGFWIDRIPPGTLVNKTSIDSILDQLVDKGVVDADAAFAMRQALMHRNGARIPSDVISELARIYEIDDSLSPEDTRDAVLAELDNEADIEDVVLFYKPDFRRPNGRYVIKVIQNGKPQLYEVDPGLYEALQGLPPETHTWFTKAADFLNRKFKAGAVGINTAFLLTNLFRDAATFAVNSKYNQGADRAVKSWAWTIEYARAIAFSKPNELVEMYREFGGEFYNLYSVDERGIQKTIRRLGGKKASERIAEADGPAKALEAAKAFGEGLEYFADVLRTMTAVSDVGPRLAEAEGFLRTRGFEIRDGRFYNTKTRRFETPTQDQFIKAMYAAGDVTYNYRRRGALINRLERVFPFTNAALQSLDKTVRTYKETLTGLGSSNANTQELAKQRFISLMTMSTIYLVLKYMMLDDDEELDQWEKDGYVTIHLPGNAGRVSIGMSREHAWIANAATAGMRHFLRGDKTAVGDFVSEEAKNRIPFGVSGAVGTTLESLIGYDFFAQRWIEPEYMASGSGKVSPKYRYDQYTTEASKYIGSIPGMSAIGMSPMRLDHWLSGVTGGAYRRWAQTGEKAVVPMLQAIGAAEEADTQPVSFRDIPFLRGIYRDRTPNVSVSDFYDWQERIQVQINDAVAAGVEPDAGIIKQLQAFQTTGTMMKLLRSASSQDYDPSQHQVALARDVMGMDQHPNYPHPLYTELPSDAKEKVRQLVFNDLDGLARGLDRPSKSDKQSNEEYAEEIRVWEARREGEREFWEKHVDSPIVQDVLSEVKTSKAFRELLQGRGKPQRNIGEKPLSQFREETKRFGERRQAAREFAGFGQGGE